eukprot:Skav230447  [mRNA]  locus=scaffold3496:122372:122611:- [translate_table: standard]
MARPRLISRLAMAGPGPARPRRGGRSQAFWHTRQRFAASLACASAACYLLGIGDRRLGGARRRWMGVRLVGRAAGHRGF